MQNDSKKLVGVAKAIYHHLGSVEFTRADIENLAKKVSDKVPWERIERSLAVKLVAVGIKAAEAAGALYEAGNVDAAQDVTPKAAEKTEPKPAETIEVRPEDVIPPNREESTP